MTLRVFLNSKKRKDFLFFRKKHSRKKFFFLFQWFSFSFFYAFFVIFNFFMFAFLQFFFSWEKLKKKSILNNFNRLKAKRLLIFFPFLIFPTAQMKNCSEPQKSANFSTKLLQLFRRLFFITIFFRVSCFFDVKVSVFKKGFS